MKHIKSSISKMNLKQSLVIAGTISGIASAVGLAVAIPVYLRIQEQLKKSLSATADLSKYFSDLMKRLGVDGDDASFKKELAGGYEVVYDNGVVKVFKNDTNGGKVLMVNTNPDGSVKTAGQFEGVLGMEMLNTLDNAKRSFGNEGKAINDILSDYASIIDNSSYEKESIITGEHEALLRARDYFIANDAVKDTSKQQPMLIKAFDDYCVAHGQELNKTQTEIDQDKLDAEKDVNANLNSYIADVLRLIKEAQDAAAQDALAAQGDPAAIAAQQAQANNIQKQIASNSNKLQSVDNSTSTKITAQNDVVGEKITDKLVADASQGGNTAAVNQLVLTAYKWIPVFAATLGYVDESTHLLTNSSVFLRDLIHKKVIDNGMTEKVFKELVENIIKMLDFKDEYNKEISDHDFEEVVEEWCGNETDVKFYRENKVAPTKKIISLVENFNNFQSLEFTDDEKVVVYQVNLKGITANDQNSYNNFIIARPGTTTFRNFQAVSLIKSNNFTSQNGLSDFRKTVNIFSVASNNTLIDQKIRREMVEKFIELLEFVEQHHNVFENDVWRLVPHIKDSTIYTELTKCLQWINQQPYGGKYHEQLVAISISASEKYLLNGEDIIFKNANFKSTVDEIINFVKPEEYLDVLKEKIEDSNFVDFNHLMSVISTNIASWKTISQQVLEDLSKESLKRKTEDDNLLFENGQNILSFYKNIEFYFSHADFMHDDAKRFFDAFEKVGDASKASEVTKTINWLKKLEQNSIVQTYKVNFSSLVKNDDATNLMSGNGWEEIFNIFDAKESSDLISATVNKVFNNLTASDIMKGIVDNANLSLQDYKLRAEKISTIFNTWANDYHVLKNFLTDGNEKDNFATLLTAGDNFFKFLDGANVRNSLGSLTNTSLSNHLIKLSLAQNGNNFVDLNNSTTNSSWNNMINFITTELFINNSPLNNLQIEIIDAFYKNIINMSTSNAQLQTKWIELGKNLKKYQKYATATAFLQKFHDIISDPKTSNDLLDKMNATLSAATSSGGVLSISETYISQNVLKETNSIKPAVGSAIGIDELIPYQQDSFFGLYNQNGNPAKHFVSFKGTSGQPVTSGLGGTTQNGTYSMEKTFNTANTSTQDRWTPEDSNHHFQIVFDDVYGRTVTSNRDISWKIFDVTNGNKIGDFEIGFSRLGLSSFEKTAFFFGGARLLSLTTTNTYSVGGKNCSDIFLTVRNIAVPSSNFWANAPHEKVAQSEDWMFQGGIVQDGISTNSAYYAWTSQFNAKTATERINLTGFGFDGAHPVGLTFKSVEIPANLTSNSRIKSMTIVEEASNYRYMAAIREDGTLMILKLVSTDQFKSFTIDSNQSFILDKIDTSQNDHFSSIAFNFDNNVLAICGDKITYYDLSLLKSNGEIFGPLYAKIKTIHLLLN